ncbi:acyl carrier protein [Maritimibacter dapengensis]|uniref:Acyl carrier protein n=1 Tax=Maritimibacter dapengensis TaxID=2836868 RepID=A0ABS6T4F8_9RHOB|nr:phosphopantetheine-binding protein [Maritimibacter dapengensis]MBV7379593.1 acyl carrier protein [Maritimibacter dapengensis]
MKDLNDHIAQKVIGILAAQALVGVSSVRLDMQLSDLGLDSLGTVETIFAIEECFDISVPFNANDPAAGGADLSTVSAVIETVRNLVEQQAA